MVLFIEEFVDSFGKRSGSPAVTFTAIGTRPSIVRTHLHLRFASVIVVLGLIFAIDTTVAVAEGIELVIA